MSSGGGAAGTQRAETAAPARGEIAALEAALLARDAVAALQVLDRAGVLTRLIPELADLHMEILPTHRHKDVHRHTMQVVAQAVALAEDRGREPSLVLSMAALLHDIGKPATRELHPDGTVSFHAHAELGARMSRTRLQTLGYDEEFIKDVCLLVDQHLRTFGYAPGKWSDAGVRRFMHDAKALLPELLILVRADITTGNPQKRAQLHAGLDDLEARIEAVRETDRIQALRPTLNGNVLMERLGLPQGPELGRLVKALTQAAREGRGLTEAEEWALVEELRGSGL